MVRVDVRTGDISPVMKQEPEVRRDRASLSLDGKTLYYGRQARARDADTFFLARDLASGTERELIHRRNMGGLLLSPDGRYLATLSQDSTQHSSTFIIIPVQGGEPREVALPMDSTANGTAPFGLFAWTPDSKSFLLRKHLSSDHIELWRVSMEGTTPQRINERLDLLLATGGVRVHPDGRRILLVPAERGPLRSQSQIMLLENFLPSRKAEKTAAR